MREASVSFLIALADELDQEGKHKLADEIDENFEKFLELLEDGKLTFDYEFSGGARDPRGPYSNPGRGPVYTHGVPGPQCNDKKATFLTLKQAGQTYTDNDDAYSVDMLIEITTKNKVEDIPIDTLKWNIEEKVWGNHSPQDVIENPKKYPKDNKKIKEVELKYPILVYKGEVIDGYHRLARAILDKKKKIKVRIVTDKQMDASRIDDKRIKELLSSDRILICK